jgi:hypothetical protein
MLTDFYDYFFPVFGGAYIKNQFIPLNIYGTATSIGRGYLARSY